MPVDTAAATDAHWVERYLEHVRVEKRLAARTVELYALDLEKLLAFARAAGTGLTGGARTRRCGAGPRRCTAPAAAAAASR